MSIALSQSQGTVILRTLALVGVSRFQYGTLFVLWAPLPSFSTIATSESIAYIQFARLGLLTYSRWNEGEEKKDKVLSFGFHCRLGQVQVPPDLYHIAVVYWTRLG